MPFPRVEFPALRGEHIEHEFLSAVFPTNLDPKSDTAGVDIRAIRRLESFANLIDDVDISGTGFTLLMLFACFQRVFAGEFIDSFFEVLVAGRFCPVSAQIAVSEYTGFVVGELQYHD